MSKRRTEAYFAGVKWDEAWQEWVPTRDGKGGTRVWFDEAWWRWTPMWECKREEVDDDDR